MTDDQGVDGIASTPAPEEIAAAVETIVQRLPPAPPPPSSTYRVQLHAGFTFRDAARIVPYLADLGIDSLYTSPFLQSAPRQHPRLRCRRLSELNPEIGGEGDLARLVATFATTDWACSSISCPTTWASPAAPTPGGRTYWRTVQLSPSPTSSTSTGAPLKRPATRQGRCCRSSVTSTAPFSERGEFRLRYEDGAFHRLYYQLPLPIAPPTYPLILRHEPSPR